jgi:hypothetical protein
MYYGIQFRPILRLEVALAAPRLTLPSTHRGAREAPQQWRHSAPWTLQRSDRVVEEVV